MSKQEIFEAIKEIMKNDGYDERDVLTLTYETRIFHDLGVLGDTVDEFFNPILVKFPFDYSQFDSSNFFPSEFSDYAMEDAWLTRPLFEKYWPELSWFKNKKKRLELAAAKYSPFTIADLIDAIKVGELRLR